MNVIINVDLDEKLKTLKEELGKELLSECKNLYTALQGGSSPNLEKRLQSVEASLSDISKELSEIKSLLTKPSTGNSSEKEKVFNSAPQGVKQDATPQPVSSQISSHITYEYYSKCYAAGFKNMAKVLNASANETDAMSKYVVEVNGEVASYYPVTSKFQELIFNLSTMLEPVCTIEGVASNAHRIDVVQKGELMKVADGWNVTKKCKIRLV